jgi:diketogulonate reductase-like aldo/keto reductase
MPLFLPGHVLLRAVSPVFPWRCVHAATQVLVRWALQHGTSVIPKASSEEHLRSNLDALQWELPTPEFKALSSIPYQVRPSFWVWSWPMLMEECGNTY